MKEKKTSNPKIVYYSDEKHQDFAKEIKPKEINTNFKYIRKNPIYNFFSYVITCFIAIPILWVVAQIVAFTRVKNRKVLKGIKHKGYFLYSNHTGWVDILNDATTITPFKKPVFIASHETFSIKGLKHVVEFLGAIPVPKGDDMYNRYVEGIKNHIAHKHKVIIYPEAHIWPYYIGIRNFSAGSFRYPILSDAPIIVATTTFKKRLLIKKPREIIYLDGPYYPNKELSYEDSVNELRNKAYEAMKNRASISSNYEYIKYVKKDS